MIKVIHSRLSRRGITLSVWFDGTVYHPLIEREDNAGNPIKGKLLKSGAKLISVMRHADDWISVNCPVIGTAVYIDGTIQ